MLGNSALALVSSVWRRQTHPGPDEVRAFASWRWAAHLRAHASRTRYRAPRQRCQAI